MSFTGSAYVKVLFEKSVGGELFDYPVSVGNWFRGHGIDHQAPETRKTVLAGFLESRTEGEQDSLPPTNYAEWLNQAFGQPFTDTFLRSNCLTREPDDLHPLTD